MSKLSTDKAVKPWNIIWRSKFILFSILALLSIFLILKTGWVFSNPDDDIQRAAQSDLRKYRSYAAEMRTKLLEGQFDLLDKVADELRTSKEKFPGGSWKLYSFYMGISDVARDGTSSEGEWKTLLGRLQKWIDAKPDSITARVALGQAYVNYAWRARGNGYADTVREEGFRLFQERLNKAEQVLNEAKKLAKRCPNWYLAMQSVALGQGWDLDRYNKLFEEAVALEPLYHYYYRNKAAFLLPRWHGEEGDWERFAEEVYEKAGAKEGSMLYCAIAYEMSGYYGYRKTFFDETKISWAKVKQGYINRETLQGADDMSLNEFCLLACLANDRPTAQALFVRIGDNYDPYVWNQGKTFYKHKAWATDSLIDKLKIFLQS